MFACMCGEIHALRTGAPETGAATQPLRLAYAMQAGLALTVSTALVCTCYYFLKNYNNLMSWNRNF